MSIEYKFKCPKQWEKLEDHPLGKYCNSCNKIVHDFSSMSDEEILFYLKKRGESICIMQERPNNTRFRSRRHTTLYTLIVGIMSFWGIGCSDNRTLGEPALPACSNAKTNVQPEEMVNEMTLGEPVVPDSTIKK